MPVLVAFSDVPDTAPTKVVAVTVPLTWRAVVGAAVPTPTLPLARIVKPLPAVELACNLANVPEVEEPVLATYRTPLVPFSALLLVVMLRSAPVVNALPVITRALPVVSESAFKVEALVVVPV